MTANLNTMVAQHNTRIDKQIKSITERTRKPTTLTLSSECESLYCICVSEVAMSYKNLAGHPIWCNYGLIAQQTKTFALSVFVHVCVCARVFPPPFVYQYISEVLADTQNAYTLSDRRPPPKEIQTERTHQSQRIIYFEHCCTFSSKCFWKTKM